MKALRRPWGHLHYCEDGPSGGQALVIGGEKGGATPPDPVAALARQIAGTRFEVIAGAGHLPAIEAPEDMGALISRFLKETNLA